MTRQKEWEKSSGNIFEDVGFSEGEAEELQLRSSMMLVLNKYIKNKGFTQEQAAVALRVSQPKISNLMSGKVDLFSINMLLAMLNRAGFHVYDRMEKMLLRLA